MHRKISLFLRTRINDPFRSLLHQGLAPDQLARGFACGLTLGILPLPWGITPLCVLVAWRLGLNQAVVQAGNWLAWPLQLLLFVPFMRIGEYLLPFAPPWISVFSLRNPCSANPPLLAGFCSPISRPCRLGSGIMAFTAVRCGCPAPILPLKNRRVLALKGEAGQVTVLF